MIATSSSQPGHRTIVWFRKDLRLADHPALDAALQANKAIIPVFIWDEEEGGNWSPGAASRWWLHHSLASLSASIAKLGGTLILAQGKAAQVLPKLAQANQADQIFYGRCYDPAGIATQEAVEEACDLQGINTESFNSSLLQEPWETKNGTGKPFQVFTPYWRKSRPIIYRLKKLPIPTPPAGITHR
jgi:deoxyribodipyrimidine photo-lyase